MIEPMIDEATALQSAKVLVQDRIKDAERWNVASARERKMQLRQGPSRVGWEVNFRRRPDKGAEQDWRTIEGVMVFVDGATGRAELLR
jgi:hypothetical protein